MSAIVQPGTPLIAESVVRHERAVIKVGAHIGGGGEGGVYLDATRPGYALKIMHAPSSFTESKVRAMLMTPPGLQTEVDQDGHEIVQICWPQESLLDMQGRFCGFTMRMLDKASTVPFNAWFSPDSRDRNKLSQSDRTRVYLAANLASVTEYVDQAGHAVIDFKPQNVLAYREHGYVCFLDCDGFLVRSGNDVFPAKVATPQYLAPEYHDNFDATQLGEMQDRFALAVVIYTLLDRGLHPAAGTSLVLPEDVAGRLKKGAVFLDPSSGLAPPPNSHYQFFADDTLQMFKRAFVGAPVGRPSAGEWRAHLRGLTSRMASCPASRDHWHYGKGCPWCRGRGSSPSRLQVPAPKAPVAPSVKASGGAGARKASPVQPGTPSTLSRVSVARPTIPQAVPPPAPASVQPSPSPTSGVPRGRLSIWAARSALAAFCILALFVLLILVGLFSPDAESSYPEKTVATEASPVEMPPTPTEPGGEEPSLPDPEPPLLQSGSAILVPAAGPESVFAAIDENDLANPLYEPVPLRFGLPHDFFYRREFYGSPQIGSSQLGVTAVVLSKTLSFYPAYTYVHVSDVSSGGPIVRRFLLRESSSSSAVSLDGSVTTILRFNKDWPIDLDASNVRDYLAFFLSIVKWKSAHFPRGTGRLLVVESGADIPWSQGASAAKRSEVGLKVRPITLGGTGEDGTFHLQACVLLHDVIYKAHFQIDARGAVTISGGLEPLTTQIPVSFSED